MDELSCKIMEIIYKIIKSKYFIKINLLLKNLYKEFVLKKFRKETFLVEMATLYNFIMSKQFIKNFKNNYSLKLKKVCGF